MVTLRRILIASLPLLACLIALPWLYPLVSPKKQVLVRFAVLITIDNELASSFAVGDLLTDGATKADLGKITQIKAEAAMHETENGAFSLPDKTRLILTIEGSGALKDEKITIGGAPLLVGKRIAIHGRGAVEGVCLWVEGKEGKG